MTADVQSRRIAAVVGALVADAAAVPLHWIYKVDNLDAMLKDSKNVAFWEPNSNPFYRLTLGSQSCYGDQSFVILKSLVENDGLDLDHLKNSTFDWFGPKSSYESPTNAVYKAKTDGENKTTLPIDGPWRHSSLKDFIRNILEGKESTGSEVEAQSMDCVPRIVSVVALYAGRPGMLEKAEAVIRSTQNTVMSVVVGLAAARLLEYFILNGPMEDAVEHVIEDLSNPKRANPQDLDKDMASFLRAVTKRKDEPHIQTARSIRISRGIPGSFQSAVHGVITGKDYRSGVEENLRVGGCNASRGGFIGACLAAQHGMSSIPESWTKKTLRYQEILDLAQKLVLIKLA